MTARDADGDPYALLWSFIAAGVRPVPKSRPSPGGTRPPVGCRS